MKAHLAFRLVRVLDDHTGTLGDRSRLLKSLGFSLTNLTRVGSIKEG